MISRVLYEDAPTFIRPGGDKASGEAEWLTERGNLVASKTSTHICN